MGIVLKILRKIRNISDPVIRDFTISAEEKMVKIADEVANEDESLFEKHIIDAFARYLDKEGYLEVITGTKNYKKAVIDSYNYNATHIRKICTQARSYDALYAQTVSLCASQSEDVCKLIHNLADCIDASSKNYDNAQPISKRLLGVFSEEFEGEKVATIAGRADNRYNNQISDNEVPEETVVVYCSNSENVELFEEYTDYIYEATDWNALGVVFLTGGMVLYKGVEMTITDLLSILSKESYNEKYVRNELNSIISSVISANKTAQTTMKNYDEAKSALEKLIGNYLKDEDTEGAFKDFVLHLGGITAVKKLAEKCPQVLDYLFSDYSQGLLLIQDIKKTTDLSGNTDMRAAVERLEDEYNSKWFGMLHSVKDFSTEMISGLTQKELKDYIEKEVGDFSVLLNVFECKETVDSNMKLIYQRKIVDDLQKGYENAIEIINSGNYTEDDIKYANNMFAMLKEATIKVYSTYRELCVDPEKQIWANDQIRRLENTTMYSQTRFEA